MVEKTHTAGWLPGLYEPFRQIGEKIADWFAPKSEASATSDFYRIDVELPGVKPEDIDLSVHENSLTVRGEKHFEHQEGGKSYFFSEREYGAFQRTFRLPSDADADSAEADFDNGVLTIRVPKHGETRPDGRKIAINRTK